MLQLILGGAGTGKTQLLFQQIAGQARADKQAILLVPEQASFESERQLYRLLGAKDAMHVEVFSFTRLCDRIFRTYGGMAGIHMEDSAKRLLMSVTLENLSETLQVYGTTMGVALIDSLCEVIHEMKSAGASPDELRRAALLQDSELSKKKLEDISLIYEAFQALIEQGYDDPDDHLLRGVKLAEGSDFFNQTCVFVDGFTAFMGAEWEMLRTILSGGAELTVSLCCETLSQEDGVFAAASATGRRLAQLADQCGIKKARPIQLANPIRYRTKGLRELVTLFPSQRLIPSNEQKGICLWECDELYDEVETVAAQIAELVREGYRYREIAVIARDMDPYRNALETIFSRYQIPYFDDRRADVAVYPLIRGLLCALEAVQNNFATDSVLALAKSGLLGLTGEQTGLLEDYAYIWNLPGRAWGKPFENHPDGMKTTLNEEAANRLEKTNVARELVIEGLLSLDKELQECDGRGFATAIYHYLLTIDAPQALQTMASAMETTEQKEFLEEGAQIWDALMGILDGFGGALGQAHMRLGRFIELFRLCVSNLQIGVLPQTLDQVLVGNADRIRPNEPRAVFVIGINEGRFPRWHTSGGLLSDAERKQLKASGVDLLQTPEQKSFLENYYLYFALTRPSERLILSFPTRDASGNGLTRSSAVIRLEQIFPGLCRLSSEQPPLKRVGGERSAFHLMAKGWWENTPEQFALRALFSKKAPKTFHDMEQASQHIPFYLTSKQGQMLFAGDLKLSPSRLERYFMCPFSFFCESGLKLKQRRKAEFNPLESGTLIHWVLQQMVQRYPVDELGKLEPALIRDECARLLTEALSQRIQNTEDFSKRFQYLFHRQVDTLTLLVRHLGLEFIRCKFRPVETELRIQQGGKCEPLSITAPDGSQIILEGVVDRLDAYETEEKRYLRVVDYKTGVKKFELGDLCHGLNMQMILYLFALCDSYGGKTSRWNLPAGVLYMPARSGIIDARRDTASERLESMRESQLKMNGLLLEDLVSLDAMEPGLSGRFIPAKKASGGELDRKKSAVATQKELSIIRNGVEQRLIIMADHLKHGEIQALPSVQQDQGEGRTVCDNCEFRMICRHEADDPIRELARLDRDAALKELEEGGGGNG